MSSPAADVALLTDPRYLAESAEPGDWYLDNILQDDRLLRDALRRLGLTSERVDWSRPGVAWSRYRCAVFRTTWDYFDRFAEFTSWLDRVARETTLCNPAALVRWNLDKHYLADLAGRGVPVVETRFIERGATVKLSEVLAESGWTDAVVKPCVSGAARHTYRLAPATAAGLDPVIERLLAHESVMLQPFQRDVTMSGEDSLMVFDGAFTHAVRKTPKAGDFRVQDDHGGTARTHTPTADQVELAERAVAACRPAPAYGRVDLVRDNRGDLAVMELELIEPELWLRYHPPAADQFAKAIADRLAPGKTDS
ncbi:ATP-grasp domain-containing protein [Gemmata sp.]|uniref:ATP-grasp domain-containing protein n=1 Tax=Gemmata sp. TaxID=1914242 RepID=UPI003F71F8F7